eukprot:gene8927-12040_t
MFLHGLPIRVYSLQIQVNFKFGSIHVRNNHYRYLHTGYLHQLKRSQVLYARIAKSPISSVDESDGLAKTKTNGVTLVIVESPRKAETIQKFFNEKDFRIETCQGHVRDLIHATDSSVELKSKYIDKSLSLTVGNVGVDVYNDFNPIYAPIPGKQQIIANLIKSSKDVSRILLATDEDREGEAISWHLLELLKPTVPVKRAVFHEITKSALVAAFENPRDIDMNLVQSQETRRMLDRLTGFTISPLLWRYVAAGLSAGRVQSCGLQQIAQRERLRWKFVESNYFSIVACFTPSRNVDNTSNVEMVCLEKSCEILSNLIEINGNRVANDKDFDDSTGELKTTKKKPSKKEVNQNHADSNLFVLDKNNTVSIVEWLGKSNRMFSIEKIDTKKISRKPPVPFITSSLQQEASRKLSFSPARTMMTAQRLYENGLITYMRTDSPVMSSEAQELSKLTVENLFGKDFVEINSADRKAPKIIKPKNAQEAHEAIRPAIVNGIFNRPDECDLSGDDLVLYKLIYCRTLASVMKSSESETITVTISTSSESRSRSSKTKKSVEVDYNSATFRSSDSFSIFPGFLKAFDLFSDKKLYKESSFYSSFRSSQQLRLTNDTSKKSKNSNYDAYIENNIDDNIDDANVEEDISEATISPISTIVKGVKCTAHTTRPPSRFTEAAFIAELENLGVGRPSTYASVLNILKEREYIIVDKQSIIPTVKGMLVSNILEKHFQEFIDAEFTAEMESNLDKIAKGEYNKLAFLKNYYLGNANLIQNDDKENNGKIKIGLLQKVVDKLKNNEIDQNESRSLRFPFLNDLGVIRISRHGLFFEAFKSNSTDIVNNSANKKSKSSEVNNSLRRWTLPEPLHDIRQISKESIIHLMNTSLSMHGMLIGVDPSNDIPITIQSGRYGKYLSYGKIGDKKSKTYKIPQLVNELSVTVDDAFDYMKLPWEIGPHPTLNYMIDVASKGHYLTVGIKGYPYRIPLPTTMLKVSDIKSIDDILPFIDNNIELLLNSCRNLGLWNEKDVTVELGRYGYFLKCNNIVCGLDKLDPMKITLEQAIIKLERKQKKLELKSSKKLKILKKAIMKSTQGNLNKTIERKTKIITKTKSLKTKVKVNVNEDNYDSNYDNNYDNNNDSLKKSKVIKSTKGVSIKSKTSNTTIRKGKKYENDIDDNYDIIDNIMKSTKIDEIVNEKPVNKINKIEKIKPKSVKLETIVTAKNINNNKFNNIKNNDNKLVLKSIKKSKRIENDDDNDKEESLWNDLDTIKMEMIASRMNTIEKEKENNLIPNNLKNKSEPKAIKKSLKKTKSIK